MQGRELYHKRDSRSQSKILAKTVGGGRVRNPPLRLFTGGDACATRFCHPELDSGSGEGGVNGFTPALEW